MDTQQSVHERFVVKDVEWIDGHLCVTAEHEAAAGPQQGSHRPTMATLTLDFDGDEAPEINVGDEFSIAIFVYPPSESVPRREG